MDKKEIIEKLTEIFRTVFNNTDLTLQEEMTADDVDAWDSLTHMLMISKVEKTFCIKIKLRELNKLNTVGNLIDLIESKIA